MAGRKTNSPPVSLLGLPRTTRYVPMLFHGGRGGPSRATASAGGVRPAPVPHPGEGARQRDRLARQGVPSHEGSGIRPAWPVSALLYEWAEGGHAIVGPIARRVRAGH